MSDPPPIPAQPANSHDASGAPSVPVVPHPPASQISRRPLPEILRARSPQTFNDALNPVMVRELRQIVRNNTLLALLCAYLGIIFLLTLYILYLNPSASPNTGWEMFVYLTGGMHILGTLAVVLFGMGNAIRDSLSNDMMFYTGLSSKQIVHGKMLSAAVLTFLFHSMLLPFLTLAYLLRGVDPGVLLFLLPSLFLTTQGAHAVALSCVIGVRTFAETLVSCFLFLIVFPCLPPMTLSMAIGAELHTGTACLLFLAALGANALLVYCATTISVHLLNNRRRGALAERVYFILVTYLLLGLVLCCCSGFLLSGMF